MFSNNEECKDTHTLAKIVCSSQIGNSLALLDLEFHVAFFFKNDAVFHGSYDIALYDKDFFSSPQSEAGLLIIVLI